MTPQDVITLLDDPETLLRRCYVRVAGGTGHAGPNGQAVLATFRVVVDNADLKKGFTSGLSGLFGRQKDRPTVQVSKQPNRLDPLPADCFNAYYIPMVQVADVTAGNSHYILPTVGAVRFVITSQITGCVFSVGSDAGGAVLASHVQPAKGTGATMGARQAEAAIAGKIGLSGPVSQVRHGLNYDADPDRVAVIGRLGAGSPGGPMRWKFYMQKTSFMNSASVVRSAAKLVEA